MTHYTISYEGLDPIAKHNAAIQDIKDYMGDERFEAVTEAIKLDDPNKTMTLDQFRLIISFAGVREYPARAWYNYIYGV